MSTSVYIVAGEPSGQMRAAELVSALIKELPGIRLCGTGGETMRKAGVEIIANSDDIAVVGLFEVLKKYTAIKHVFDTTLDALRRIQPDCLILVDYPGFNIRLAKAARKLLPGMKIVYYVAPQVWAWHKSRIKTLKQCVDLMLVILPFEEQFFKNHGMDAEFIGHPVTDRLTPYKQDSANKDKNLIALLPGSRDREIRTNLPVMADAVSELKQRIHGVRAAIGASDETIDMMCTQCCELFIQDIPIEKDVCALINRARAAVVCSGTATLETGYLGTPMVIVYKLHPLTYLAARHRVKLPRIGLVNIVLGKDVCPELIQGAMTSMNIADQLYRLLTDNKAYTNTRNELASLDGLLGSFDKGVHGARLIKELLA